MTHQTRNSIVFKRQNSEPSMIQNDLGLPSDLKIKRGRLENHGTQQDEMGIQDKIHDLLMHYRLNNDKYSEIASNLFMGNKDEINSQIV